MLAATHDIDSGIRKAAILVASLESPMADQLLDQLSPECADRVRQAVMVIDWVDADEQQRVIEEFRRIELMMPKRCPSGIDLNNLSATPPKSATRPVEPVEAEMSMPTPEPIETMVEAESEAVAVEEMPLGKPFEFLLQTDEETLVLVLSEERPQTIAIVLSHLPPERAGDILMRFSSSLQADVLRRLMDFSNADPETVREIEQVIESRLVQQYAEAQETETRTSGPELVARILAACPNEMAQRILENLAGVDVSLAEQLGRKPVRFECLEQVDDQTLLQTIHMSDPEVVVTALVGASPSMVDRVLNRLVPEDARRLKQRLRHPDPFRLSDMEEASRRLVALAERIADENEYPMARAA
jgi:flagellar motor switch protein FliG